MNMDNKVALVTGGGQGIGQAICKLLALRGAKVIVADIDENAGKKTVEEIVTLGGNAKFFKVDVSKVSEIKQAIEYALNQYGDINILVNNAGMLHSTSIEEITEEEWDKINAVNLKSVFFACQAAIPHFKRNNYGKIINMSSMAGRNGGISAGMAYSATKAGIIGLTKGLANQLAKYKINVNAVCPGTTKTAILDSFTKEQISAIEEKIPVGRLGSVQDIAYSVCFLCSEESDFITGIALDVNGGLYIGS